MTELFIICGFTTCIWCTIWLARNGMGSALYSRPPALKEDKNE